MKPITAMAAVPEALDIEDSLALLVWLRAHGHLAPGETPRCTNLHGGVSNRTVLVERFSGEAWVLKQALEKLRVAADWHSDRRRIHREAHGLRWLARLAPPGAITPLLFDDHAQHLLAMKAVPEPHENWKTMLLDHEPDVSHVRQFGGLLGTIHRRSAEKRETIAVAQRGAFLEAARLHWRTYAATAGGVADAPGFASRAVRHTLGCQL